MHYFFEKTALKMHVFGLKILISVPYTQDGDGQRFCQRRHKLENNSNNRCYQLEYKIWVIFQMVLLDNSISECI